METDKKAGWVDEPVSISPYNPAWPDRFEQERVALQAAIGECAIGGIHHVGSTAVPGLEAKPILDILVGVESLAASRRCFAPLEALDYLYAPYLAGEMHWFCKPHPSRRTHHLHLIPVASPRYRDELAFRDLLRAEPGLAHRYAALKRHLAGRFEHDREAYTEAKSAFIADAVASAQLRVYGRDTPTNGGIPMATEVKNFNSPDETRPFEGNGQAKVVKLAGHAVAEGTFEPGWKWSENVKPIAGTDSCQVAHFGYVLSGSMRIFMDDGTEAEVNAGDVFAIPPGHDAEVPGPDACVMVDFGEIGDYAKRG